MATKDPAPGHVRPAENAPRSRLAYIDNLRILLTVFVVLHHAAVTYGNLPVWFYTEPAQDPTGGLLDAFMALNQTFFMGFFFLVSGIFVPGSADRRGARSFLRGRLVRLGVPLLLFLLLLRPLVDAGTYIEESAGEMPYWLYYFVSWDPGPMWFVETLLVFALAYLLIRRFRPPAPERIARRRTGRLPGPAAIAGFTLGLVTLTYLWRVLVPATTYWPIVGLPTPAFLPQYVLLFTVGVLAYRRGWFDAIPRAAGWGGLAVALASLVFLAPPALASLETALLPGTWGSLLMAAFENTFAVGAILFLLWLFQRRFDRQGPSAVSSPTTLTRSTSCTPRCSSRAATCCRGGRLRPWPSSWDWPPWPCPCPGGAPLCCGRFPARTVSSDTGAGRRPGHLRRTGPGREEKRIETLGPGVPSQDRDRSTCAPVFTHGAAWGLR
ncbi:acyltransferase family protein [Nocardiopsis xinjiangensis]|uniref:acyltransferase family protein n=1 Tax=Nocardiopsis xinjiangensis TaxID=124285 RepID=UPI000347B867|nr:acyltransferase [Nocardiopsis xinjiangensis]